MRTIDSTLLDKQDVRHMGGELYSRGVTIVDQTELILKCNACGETWMPPVDSSGKLEYKFWICPQKCNAAHEL